MCRHLLHQSPLTWGTTSSSHLLPLPHMKENENHLPINPQNLTAKYFVKGLNGMLLRGPSM